MELSQEFIIENQRKSFQTLSFSSNLLPTENKFSNAQGISIDRKLEDLENDNFWSIYTDEKTDEKGWQYAEDFSSNVWLPKDSNSWVRKRKWIRTVPDDIPSEIFISKFEESSNLQQNSSPYFNKYLSLSYYFPTIKLKEQDIFCKYRNSISSCINILIHTIPILKSFELD